MMMNKLPTSMSLIETYRFIELNSRSNSLGQRNRCLFALRLAGLRIRDIANLSPCDLITSDLTLKLAFVSEDNKSFPLDEHTRQELMRYLCAHYQIQRIDQFPLNQFFEPLFSTQKMTRWSAGTLAQHFSLTDKSIWAWDRALNECPANTPSRRFQQFFLRSDSCIASATENRFTGLLSLA